MSEVSKVLPRYSPEAEPFWQGLREGEVRLQRCRDCERYQYYPRPICSHCWSENVEWQTVNADGTVYSYTVPGFAPHPSFKDSLPYVVALVDLDVGVRVMTTIVECQPESVRIGMPVEPVLATIAPGHVLLHFKPKNGRS